MNQTRIYALCVGLGALAMLAGGCAVGAGVSGGAILSLTAWVAAAAMWVGALLTQALLEGPARRLSNKLAA